MEEIKFIVTLTTLPPRYSNIHQALDSICNQAYDNYEVHLNVPKETQFDGKDNNELSKLNYGDRLKIFYVDDVGSITKIYYTLQRFDDPEQWIVSVDDDFVLNKYMLYEYNHFIQSTNMKDPFGPAGIYPVKLGVTNGSLNCIGAVKEPTRVGVLESYNTICYRRGHFTDDFFTNGYKYHYNDDLTTSAWLGLNGIQKWCIPYRFETNFQNRVLTFPLEKVIPYPRSGVAHQRDAEGGSQVSYPKFYNGEYGKGIQV